MALELALLDFSRPGEVRLLGRVNAPELVEPVRTYLIQEKIKGLHGLGFDRDEVDDDNGPLEAA